MRHERQKESEYSKARAGEQARERDSPRARDKNRTQGNWKYDKNKVVDKDKDRGWTRDRDRDRFRGGVGNRERSMDRGEEKDWGRDRDAFIDTNGSRRYERERHREGSIRSSTSAKNGKAGKPDRSRSRSPLRSPSPRSPPQRTRPVAGNRGRDTAREEQPEPEARHEPVFAETVEEPSAPAVGQGRILARKAPLEGTNPFTSAASPPLLATAAPRPSAPKALQLSDDTKSSIPLASNTLTNGQTAIESPPKRSGWKVVRSASPSVVRASNASSQPPASSSASTRATYSEHSPTGQLATQLQPTSASMDVDSDVDGAPMDADSSGDPMPMPTPGTLHTSGNRSPGPVQGTSASQLDTMSCATMQGSGQAPHSRAIQGMPPPPARFTSDLQTANQENAVHLKTKEGIGRAPSTFSLQKSQPRAQASEPTAAPRPTRSPAPSAAMLAAMAAAADTDPSSAPLAPGNLNRELPPAPVAEISPPRAMPGEAYERIVQVGEGTYGQVFKARAEQSGVLVALKKIRMEAEKDGFPVTAMREIKLLQALRHRNVVRLHEMMVSRGKLRSTQGGF